MNIYSEDHIRLLKALAQNSVKFLLIGGHAAIYYGVMRNTGDMDLLVEPTIDNGNKLLATLSSLGLEIPEMNASEFEHDLVLSFGLAPDGVDILNYTPGIEFSSAYKNARVAKFHGVEIRIIDIVDLIKNKESLQRQGEKSLLDKYDVEVLKRILKDGIV